MDNTQANYKDTVNLPKTDFPMKGNLPQLEPTMIANWEQNQIYQKMIAQNKNNSRFTLPDGPPYANGDIHVGHVLNKVLKDIVIKYKNMSGQFAAFIPGWDCHGLPIELNVTKKLGPKRRELTDTVFRRLCREEATKWIEKQQEQFIRLGVLADWKNRYLTMHKEYEAEQVRQLAKMLKNGVLYRGEKPVYWDWALETALAEAEVEYHNHKSPSVYVKFFVEDQASLKMLGNPNKPTAFVIWTTTPWTLPANVAISLHPSFEYSLYDAGNEYWVIANDLQEAMTKDTSIDLHKSTYPSFKGKNLEHIKTRHPFVDRNSLVILGEHVTKEAGTGCVHTAPGHGQEDYIVGLQYNLPVLSPVDTKGKFTNDVPLWAGEHVLDANPKIVLHLKSTGHLIASKDIEHQYPHGERSKAPVIFRATPQWFISMDGQEYNLREKAKSEVEKVKFYPEWGKQRFTAMIGERPDWCITRQRTWGVPIPIFYCKATGQALVDYDVMMNIADIMEKEDGIEAYYRHQPEDFGVNSKKSGEFGSQGFTHSKDIFDVWFDSGICHSAVQGKRPELDNPADIYLEGSDQHRGWFNTSFFSSLATNGHSPFKALLTHGFVVDSQGRKMSKSLGNVVNPIDIYKKDGAEILRLWVSYEDYGQDISVGQTEFQRVTETYRRFRNTMRFMLGNLCDFNPDTDKINYNDLLPVDKWALLKLNEVNQKVIDAYESYAFNKIYHSLNQFFTVDLSATYLDILKDRLYTWKATGQDRRSAQTVVYEIIHRTIRMMAPILSFLAEETYSYLPGSRQESVFLTTMPKPEPTWYNKTIEEDFAVLLTLRTEVSKALETLRADKIIGSNLDAKISITSKDAQLTVLKKYEKHLCEFFIVSQVELLTGEPKLTTTKAEGEKCVRCWNYSTQIGQNQKFPGTCPKCVEALS